MLVCSHWIAQGIALLDDTVRFCVMAKVEQSLSFFFCWTSPVIQEPHCANAAAPPKSLEGLHFSRSAVVCLKTQNESAILIINMPD